MSKAAGKHAWAFAPRFRRGAFGWRSAPALARIKEAMPEIKAAGRKDAFLAAEGALTRRFARLAAGRLRTVSLVPEVPRIGPEHLSTAQAFTRSLALHGPALLAADHPANERSLEVKRKSKRRGKRETKNDQEETKKRQSSDRQLRRKGTFTPPTLEHFQNAADNSETWSPADRAMKANALPRPRMPSCTAWP
jgi:hypothetical protein